MAPQNRLAEESSPYLRQHADNPVDWYPWGDEAFERAAREDKPVFLSVGYASCHWCHVMAHESFEDEVVAAYLNEHFVSVKVDREERPDVDAVYMDALQAFSGSGGWPMSVFLTPDRRPFFAGTYFPRSDAHGRPSFTTVLRALVDVWTDRREDVEEQADELTRAVHEAGAVPDLARKIVVDTGDGAGDWRQTASALVEALAARFDGERGGFGRAPKFPQATLIDACLTIGRLDASELGQRATAMAAATLEAIVAGGIHDHLGGGFARYSTDDEWLVPHFEKMLYDQAGLLRCLLHAWQVTGSDDLALAMDRLVAYVLRDLRQPPGAGDPTTGPEPFGLASGEDADSEGVEGRFYVWTPEQVADALDGPDGPSTAAATAFWGVTAGGNFEGASILARPRRAPLAGDGTVESARAALLAARGWRVRPGMDDKVLTEWNAMFASALAEAAGATGRDDWARAAVAIGTFLWERLRRDDGRLMRSWQSAAGARHLAYGADHAWFLECALRLSELTGEAVWMERARHLAAELLERFAADDGGIFTTGSDAEALLVRQQEYTDGATPSTNGIAAYALWRLGALTGEQRWSDASRAITARVGALVDARPVAVPLSALCTILDRHGATEVVVAGDRPDLVEVARRTWSPEGVLAWGERFGGPLWEGRRDGYAYVCHGFTCRAPADSADSLAADLAAARAPAPPAA